MIKQYIDRVLLSYKPYKENKCWCYEDGVMLLAAKRMYEVFNDQKYLNFIEDYLDFHINNNGDIYLYDETEYNIDNIQAGTVLFFAYEKLRKEKYLLAIEKLYNQLLNHPRTKKGNFWHKNRYPYQVWLDGLYMAQPFYAMYAKMINNKKIYNDIISQFENVRKYLFDEKRNLYVHAYDELKVMNWADKMDGKSPNVWLRSVGWLAMALVDTYEVLEDETHDAVILSNMLIELFDGILKYQDSETNMWYQVVDNPLLEDNYFETSGTAMLAYSLIKAYHLGLVPSSYSRHGKSAYHGIINKYLKCDKGEIKLFGICKVAGLDNERRNGSTSYYLSEPKVADDSKGVAPFIYAFCELLLGES
jgi:unsaturated rhamnogalacturonyl hydrolase